VKANPEISAKYKLYHKAFRKTNTPARKQSSRETTRYISSVSAMKLVTPRKQLQHDDLDMITPLKSRNVNIDLESVGPTPQLNGRMLGLFDGIQDNTPPWKLITPMRRRHPNITGTPNAVKISPQKAATEDFWEVTYRPSPNVIFNGSRSDSQETPTKSTTSSIVRTRYTTPTTYATPTLHDHGFATPAFLRPMAPSIQSPQSPSLPWEKIPSNVKGLSALIGDFKANQHQISDDEHYQCDEFLDHDHSPLMSQDDAPETVQTKTWTKRGAKRTTRRVKSSQLSGHLSDVSATSSAAGNSPER
jgi:DNA replication regulator SLD2